MSIIVQMFEHLKSVGKILAEITSKHNQSNSKCNMEVTKKLSGRIYINITVFNYIHNNNPVLIQRQAL